MRGIIKKVLLCAFVAAALITAVSWLALGIHSPVNHGVPPNVRDQPFIFPIVILNLPAGIVAVNLFGFKGPEWTYFLTIFAQWFLLAALIGGFCAWIRKQSMN